jgi:hypothetical protein
MSDMSYCRFENTLKDLKECLVAILNNEKLSESEKNAKEQLVQVCLKIVSDEYPDLADSEDNPLNY